MDDNNANLAAMRKMLVGGSSKTVSLPVQMRSIDGGAMRFGAPGASSVSEMPSTSTFSVAASTQSSSAQAATPTASASWLSSGVYRPATAAPPSGSVDSSVSSTLQSGGDAGFAASTNAFVEAVAGDVASRPVGAGSGTAEASPEATSATKSSSGITTKPWYADMLEAPKWTRWLLFAFFGGIFLYFVIKLSKPQLPPIRPVFNMPPVSIPPINVPSCECRCGEGGGEGSAHPPPPPLLSSPPPRPRPPRPPPLLPPSHAPEHEAASADAIPDGEGEQDRRRRRQRDYDDNLPKSMSTTTPQEEGVAGVAGVENSRGLAQTRGRRGTATPPAFADPQQTQLPTFGDAFSDSVVTQYAGMAAYSAIQG